MKLKEAVKESAKQAIALTIGLALAMIILSEIVSLVPDIGIIKESEETEKMNEWMTISICLTTCFFMFFAAELTCNLNN